jgi:hypothetical protein
MKLIAKATISYGPNAVAAPGDTFELDEKKYPESVAQLLASGEAEKADAAKPKAKD